MLMGFANFAPHKEKSYYIVEFGDWSNINSSKKQHLQEPEKHITKIILGQKLYLQEQVQKKIIDKKFKKTCSNYFIIFYILRYTHLFIFKEKPIIIYPSMENHK